MDSRNFDFRTQRIISLLIFKYRGMKKGDDIQYLPSRERDLMKDAFKRYDRAPPIDDPDADFKSYGGHNPKSKMKSQCCSLMIAPAVPDNMPCICEYHRRYMAASVATKCGCQELRASSGGKAETWDYHEYYDIKGPYPFIGPVESMKYCCSNCPNYKKKNRYMCGDMYVCLRCAKKHDRDTLVKC